jgi:two-component system, sensor histidine kinase and response regulator
MSSLILHPSSAFTAHLGRQSHPPDPVPAQPPVSLSDLPVLVVDDNATNRHILEEWLRGWQMDPTTVGDGMAAMDALWHGAVLSFRLWRSDGILVDWVASG